MGDEITNTIVWVSGHRWLASSRFLQRNEGKKSGCRSFGDPEITVQCLGIKAKTTSSNSVRVYVHYRVINDSLKDKFGILDFKAHCPFKNELSELKGGFVVTNLGPEENEESENLWYFPQGCWDKVQEVELHWKKLPLDHPLNPNAR